MSVTCPATSIALIGLWAIGLTMGPSLRAQQPAARDSGGRVTPAHGDSVTINLVDVDLRAAVTTLAPYLDRPVSFGAVPVIRVTLETPRPVPRSDILRLTRGLVESQNMLLVTDSVANMYRVEPKPPPAAAPSAAATVLGGAGQSVSGAPEFFVIHLHHARAADVAATINALYGRASALGEGGLGGTLSQQLARNQLAPAGVPPPAGSPSSNAQSAVFTGETSIVPDAGTNSLFIRANRADFDLISAAIRELDVRPLQVLIEVIIAEIDKNADLNIGVDASGRYINPHGDTSLGGTLIRAGAWGFRWPCDASWQSRIHRLAPPLPRIRAKPES